MNASMEVDGHTARPRRSESARRLAKHIHDGDLRDDTGNQVLRHRQRSVALSAQPASADGSATRAGEKDSVQLDVRFSWLHVHSVDTEQQEFTAEFFVDARAIGRSELVPRADDTKADAAKRWTPDLFVRNMCDGELVRGEDLVHGADASYRRHWRGSFKQEFQLHEFPFDVQDFQLLLVEHTHDRTVTMISDKQLPSIFHIHSFTLNNVWSLMGVHEITLPTAFSSLQVTKKRLELHVERMHTDPSESTRAQTFPMLRAGIYMRRQSTAYCWNIIAPMFVMTSMCYVVSELPCHHLQDRLSNGLALLLAAVAYKFTAAQGLPTLSYLTLLDKYVMTCFFFITLMVGLNWFVVFIDGDHCTDRLDPIFLRGWLCCWGAANLIMLIVLACARARGHKGVQVLEQSRMPDAAHLQLHACARHGQHAAGLHVANGDDGNGNGSCNGAEPARSARKAGLRGRLRNAVALDEPLLTQHQAGSELPTINNNIVGSE